MLPDDSALLDVEEIGSSSDGAKDDCGRFHFSVSEEDWTASSEADAADRYSEFGDYPSTMSGGSSFREESNPMHHFDNYVPKITEASSFSNPMHRGGAGPVAGASLRSASHPLEELASLGDTFFENEDAGAAHDGSFEGTWHSRNTGDLITQDASSGAKVRTKSGAKARSKSAAKTKAELASIKRGAESKRAAESKAQVASTVTSTAPATLSTEHYEAKPQPKVGSESSSAPRPRLSTLDGAFFEHHDAGAAHDDDVDRESWHSARSGSKVAVNNAHVKAHGPRHGLHVASEALHKVEHGLHAAGEAITHATRRHHTSNASKKESADVLHKS
jgi:hypothetical protein